MHRILGLLFLAASSTAFSQSPYLFIGTYTHGKSKGIYVYRFNTATGTATEVSTIMSDNPSYLALAGDGKHLYAANESGGPTSSVGAFSFDPSTGQLLALNTQSSGGNGACYVATDKTGKWVTVANYGSGSLAALPINSDGSLAPAAQVIQHSGPVFLKERQGKTHVHSTIFSPDEKYLYVADLGTDKEHIYRFDASQPTPLSEATDSFVSVTPGSGPRHLVFHPEKPFVYLISEISGTVDAFRYEENTGKLIPFQRIRTTPADFTKNADGADIHISPNGKFLYASNRGASNTIAVFAIAADGRLTNKQYVPVKGIHPRSFAIDPTGRFLLAANQDSDNIVFFAIDMATGLLKPTGTELSIPNPVCLKFLAQ